jgi:hypothetical protein
VAELGTQRKVPVEFLREALEGRAYSSWVDIGRPPVFKIAKESRDDAARSSGVVFVCSLAYLDRN